MHKVIFTLIAVCTLAFSGPVAKAQTADKKTDPKLEALAFLERTALSLIASWRERQRTVPKVETIAKLSGPVDDQETKEQLKSRYKTLLKKGRSNRQWKTYWLEETKSAMAVAAVYGRLIKGSKPLAGTPNWEGWGALSPEAQRIIKAGGLLDTAVAALVTKRTSAEAAVVSADGVRQSAVIDLAKKRAAITTAIKAGLVKVTAQKTEIRS